MDLTEIEKVEKEELGSELIPEGSNVPKQVDEKELGSVLIPEGSKKVPQEVVRETKEVKQRVKALKKIQVEIAKIEARFYTEMHVLECKYMTDYSSKYATRRNIIIGDYEPTEEEGDFVQGSDCENNGDSDENEIKLEAGDTKPEKEKVKGIPDFWLTIFQNVEMLQEMTSEKDIPILQHLDDISVNINEKPMGFTLVFHFSPNEYFTNTQLTKTYEMKCEVDVEDPFSFDGPEIFKSKGCSIDWAKGKDVTIEKVYKRQFHKRYEAFRVISSTIAASSFFNFFDPIEIPDWILPIKPKLDEEIKNRMCKDFEVGCLFREKVVPHAVLYYADR